MCLALILYQGWITLQCSTQSAINGALMSHVVVLGR